MCACVFLFCPPSHKKGFLSSLIGSHLDPPSPYRHSTSTGESEWEGGKQEWGGTAGESGDSGRRTCCNRCFQQRRLEAAAPNNSGTPSEEGGGVSVSQSRKHRRCSTSSSRCDDKFCRWRKNSNNCLEEMTVIWTFIFLLLGCQRREHLLTSRSSGERRPSSSRWGTHFSNRFNFAVCVHARAFCPNSLCVTSCG